MGRRFVLDRTGTFEAMHVYADLLQTQGEASMHWNPNVIEMLGFQFLMNRLRPFKRFNTPSRTEGMPKLSRNEFAGFLQFLQWSEDPSVKTSIVKPAAYTWTTGNEHIPILEDRKGRPPIHQDVTPPITAVDAEILALFHSDDPLKRVEKWQPWLQKTASVDRVFDIIRLDGDAFTEQVTHPVTKKVVAIDELVACEPQEKGETWATQVWVNTAKGRILLPVSNSIPRIDFPGFEVDEQSLGEQAGKK